MGTVRINHYNYTLMNLCYSDIKHLKKLLRNYYNLQGLAEAGDGVALAIYIDISTVLEPDKQILTAIQWGAVIDYYINRHTLTEMSEAYGKSVPTVLESVNSGVKRIQRALLEGERLYE